MFCVEFARKQIKNSSAGAIAAVLVEPFQGTAGNVIPPDEFPARGQGDRPRK